jgi:hypothetical protein
MRRGSEIAVGLDVLVSVLVSVLVLADLATMGLVALDVLLLFGEGLLGAILLLHDDSPFELVGVLETDY